jgi:hypothetical protein
MSRWMAIDLYIRQLDNLSFELSIKKCSENLASFANEILLKGYFYSSSTLFVQSSLIAKALNQNLVCCCQLFGNSYFFSRTHLHSIIMILNISYTNFSSLVHIFEIVFSIDVDIYYLKWTPQSRLPKRRRPVHGPKQDHRTL